jgi:hypothetical protein
MDRVEEDVLVSVPTELHRGAQAAEVAGLEQPSPAAPPLSVLKTCDAAITN